MGTSSQIAASGIGCCQPGMRRARAISVFISALA